MMGGPTPVVGRRRFLGLLALAPTGIKSLAAEALALTGVGVGSPRVYLPLGDPSSASAPTSDGGRERKPLTWMASMFRSQGIPFWVRRQLRSHARDVNYLDPGIAALRSVSLVGKFAAQRQQNYDRYKHAFRHRFENSIEDERKAFAEKTGWWL